MCTRLFSRDQGALVYYKLYFRNSSYIAMPQYCCVPLCTNFGGHRFPTESKLRDKWRVAVKRVDPLTKRLWEPGKYDVVCQSHFRDEDYTSTLLGQDDHINKPVLYLFSLRVTCFLFLYFIIKIKWD
jgi:hypothetical protein